MLYTEYIETPPNNVLALGMSLPRETDNPIEVERDRQFAGQTITMTCTTLATPAIGKLFAVHIVMSALEMSAHRLL